MAVIFQLDFLPRDLPKQTILKALDPWHLTFRKAALRLSDDPSAFAQQSELLHKQLVEPICDVHRDVRQPARSRATEHAGSNRQRCLMAEALTLAQHCSPGRLPD